MPRFIAPMVGALALAVLLAIPSTAAAGASGPPNLVAEMALSYVDPLGGERRECGEGCRRFEVPAGVELEIRVRVFNQGDNPASDGVDWDLWFDQVRSPFPPEDLEACFDSEQRLDTDCYYGMMDRVDWDWWDIQDADRVCVPDDPDDCFDETISITMDADFKGSRGTGAYSFVLWVDRFDTHVESDDFDNVAGPVRVKVLPAAEVEAVKPFDSTVSIDAGETMAAPATVSTSHRSPVFSPTSSRPYAVEIIPTSTERAFTVSSGVARPSLEFIPSYPGSVTVDVEQVGAWEKMKVQLRKVSTGEILTEGSGKGRIRLAGQVQKVQLVDDRLFEVQVLPEPGTRGLRGTISVSYPDRAVYIRNN
jgi:hypothetical protein